MRMDSLHLFSTMDTEEEQDDDVQEDSSNPHSAYSKSDTRKSNKPIMEKRRRARINSCLNDLKGILLEAMRKDPARHSKLEKADILELTVRHLQSIQRNQLAVAMATDPTVLYRFKNGFSECASEVSRYLCKLDGVDTGMKHRVSNHLSSCVSGLQGVNPVGYPTGGSRYPSRPPGEMSFSHLIPFSPPSLPSTLLTPTQAEDDLNNNNSIAGDCGGVIGRVSAFTTVGPVSGEDETVPSGGKRRLVEMDALDYSLTKETKADIGPRQVRVVKVEPTMHLSLSSESISTPGKDSMWRPW